MKKMKKMVLIAVMVFSLALGQTITAMAYPSSGAIVDGGFVSASFEGGSIYGTVVNDDYFFTVNNAIQYANKISVSSAEAIEWLLTSAFIPLIGTDIGIISSANMIVRSQAVTDIRKLTDANKKVHVTVCTTNGVYSIQVHEWNGTFGQIKSSLDWASYLGVTYSNIYWKIGTTTYTMAY